MKSLLRAVVLLVILISLSACKNLLKEANISKDDFFNEFDKKVSYLMKQYGVPGTSVLIIHNGEIVFKKGYGYANVKEKIPVNEKTVFRIASISKPVAALGIMKIVEEGKLKLDTPIEKYLKRWHIPPSKFNSDGVTVRRLLSHTSGLNIEGYPLYEPGKHLPSIEQSISGAAGKQWRVSLQYEPGITFYYSSGGYAVLQLLVEEITGEKFESYMKKEVFDPLGLKNTGYDSSVWTKTTFATGYTGTGKAIKERNFVDFAGAGLMTTSEDLGKIVLFCMDEKNGNSILKQETLNMMFTPSPNAKNMFGDYGLGFSIQGLSNEEKMISHSGDIVGWNAQMAFMPKRNNAIIILTNSDAGYYFKSDLLGVWSMWSAGGINNDTKFLNNMKRIIVTIVFVLLLLLIIFITNTYLQVRKGKRKISLKFRGRKWNGWIFPMFSALCIVGWFFICYSQIPFKVVYGLEDYELYTFFSPQFLWITVMIVLFGLYFISKSIFTEKVKLN